MGEVSEFGDHSSQKQNEEKNKSLGYSISALAEFEISLDTDLIGLQYVLVEVLEHLLLQKLSLLFESTITSEGLFGNFSTVWGMFLITSELFLV